MNCERCGTVATAFNLFDYCAECSKNLCGECMAAGCCGQVPAESGTAFNAQDEGEDSEPDFTTDVDPVDPTMEGWRP